jgi:DNA-3-methyladenine glycosylase I
MLGDASIVRHRGKIESTINNAKRALEIIEEAGSLSAYVWGFMPPADERPKQMTRDALRAMTTTPAAVALSKDLKRRGWSFVGPTTVYAFMQAMGMVNDHLEGCVIRKAGEAARKAGLPAGAGRMAGLGVTSAATGNKTVAAGKPSPAPAGSARRPRARAKPRAAK